MGIRLLHVEDAKVIDRNHAAFKGASNGYALMLFWAENRSAETIASAIGD